MKFATFFFFPYSNILVPFSALFQIKIHSHTSSAFLDFKERKLKPVKYVASGAVRREKARKANLYKIKLRNSLVDWRSRRIYKGGQSCTQNRSRQIKQRNWMESLSGSEKRQTNCSGNQLFERFEVIDLCKVSRKRFYSFFTAYSFKL